MAIEGLEEVVVTLTFRVPPGETAAQVATLAQHGVSLSAYLAGLAKNANYEVRPSGPSGRALS